MRRPMITLLVAVLVLFTAQQLITPILAPLSRELQLTETQLGLVVTVSALMLTVASPLWGRALDVLGLRVVLLAGLGLATFGLAGFAVVAALGLAGATAPPVTFVLFLTVRSLLFGAGIAALPVAALAVAGATTSTAAERTRAVGQVGAVQGLSLVLGPAVGGLLAVVSLTLPLYVAPVITVVLAVWVLATVPGLAASAERRPRVAGIRPWDRRVAPMLVIGFMLYLSLGLVQVIIGFLVADRLDLDPRATAGAVGLVLVAAGVVLVLAQGVIVPRLGWTPKRLLRVGVPIGAAAFVLLATADALWSMALAFGIQALGMGLAVPGYTAGASLTVGPERQGAMAGLITATTGATFVVGPLLSTALYQRVDPVAPVLTAMGAALAALVLVWVTPPRDETPDPGDAGPPAGPAADPAGHAAAADGGRSAG